MQLIIDTADTKISVKNKCFFIQNKSMQRQISPHRISSIAITTNCTINAAAIKLAAHRQVPILFFNNFGTLQARTWSPYFVNLAELRKKQLLFAMNPAATNWIVTLLSKKVTEQMTNLQRLVKKRPRWKAATTESMAAMEVIHQQILSIQDQPMAAVRNSLMGYEGSISRHYFKAINRFLPPDFKFAKRSRRPAMDYFNAGLNYLYGMTYSVVEGGVFAKGLDPFVGVLHVDSFKKTTLVFDLIEPIRPVVDRILLDLVLNDELQPEHFIKKNQGFWMGKKGKRIVITTFNRFLQQRISFHGSVKRMKDHIYEESNQLGHLIEKTITQL